MGYFNPRAPRGARRGCKDKCGRRGHISIHAPREGRDLRLFTFLTRLKRISIHAPREGRDPSVTGVHKNFYISIHAPREGRDVGVAVIPRHNRNFNPRAPRGARQFDPADGLWKPSISIHAPREGRDDLTGMTFRELFGISIHAPREGRDSKSEQISLHIFAKKAWIPDIFAQNAAFQSVLPLADRQKLLYLRCEPLRKFLRAFASHYKIIGSSGR